MNGFQRRLPQHANDAIWGVKPITRGCIALHDVNCNACEYSMAAAWMLRLVCCSGVVGYPPVPSVGDTEMSVRCADSSILIQRPLVMPWRAMALRWLIFPPVLQLPFSLAIDGVHAGELQTDDQARYVLVFHKRMDSITLGPTIGAERTQK